MSIDPREQRLARRIADLYVSDAAVRRCPAHASR